MHSCSLCGSQHLVISFQRLLYWPFLHFRNEISVPSLQTHDGKELTFIGVRSVRVRSYWPWVWLFRFAVILSNFNYCPLIWLFCNEWLNKGQPTDGTYKARWWKKDPTWFRNVVCSYFLNEIDVLIYRVGFAHGWLDPAVVLHCHFILCGG